MRMGLTVEILGLVIFLGAHVFVTMRERRAALVARIGEWPYRGLFSLVSIVGIVLDRLWLCRLSRRRPDRRCGIRRSGRATSWWSLMWPASIMVAAAYIPGNIKRVLKHPMLVGVKTWAFAHLCANGDLGGMILFGSVLAWAVYDRITLKRRSDPGAPPIPVGGTQERHHRHHRRHHHLSGARLGVPSDRHRRAGVRNAGVRDIESMSVQNEIRRLTAPDIRARKGGEPIVCLTSYHAHTARIVDAYCDVILVGDSLGMVMHGLETTVPVTLDMMILQGARGDARLAGARWSSSTCRSAPMRGRRSRPSPPRRG